MGKIDIQGGVFTGAVSALLAGAGGIAVAEAHTWPWYLGWVSIALAVGLLIWGVRFKGIGLVHYLRGQSAIRNALSSRKEFIGERVNLADIIGADRLINDKTFERCVITSSTNICLIDHCSLVMCSSATSPFIMVPEGADARHLIGCYNVNFDRCHFQGLLIEATPTVKAQIEPQINVATIEQWRAQYER